MLINLMHRTKNSTINFNTFSHNSRSSAQFIAIVMSINCLIFLLRSCHMNMAASTPINIQQSLGEQRQVFRSDNHKKGRAHVNVCFFFRLG